MKGFLIGIGVCLGLFAIFSVVIMLAIFWAHRH